MLVSNYLSPREWSVRKERVDRLIKDKSPKNIWISYETRARYWGIPYLETADFVEPLYPSDYQFCSQYCCIPLRIEYNQLIIAIADPLLIPKVTDHFLKHDKMIGFVMMHPNTIRQAVHAKIAPTFSKIATKSCPKRHSCRNWKNMRFNYFLTCVFLALFLLSLTHMPLILMGILMTIMLFNSVTSSLRMVALFTGVSKKKPSTSNLRKKAPKISMMVPLFKEERALPQIIAAINAQTYPKELMEVFLLIEEIDHDTQKALENFSLPDHIHPLIVPDNQPRTKPKALNFGLRFASGDVIGIWDAEDIPEPEQLSKIAHAYQTADPDVMCWQGELTFYNPHKNWLSRCFALEYGIWFRVLLKGMVRLKFPIPLGGTTMFFRSDALRKIGGWDAHNVTEDADLGIRLAKYGFRCEFVDTKTYEEATATPMAWVKQRSRWIKGYLLTAVTHARNPKKAIKTMGLLNYSIVFVMLLGGIVSHLSQPVFWLFWLHFFGIGPSFILNLPYWLVTLFTVTAGLGLITQLTAAVIAHKDKKDWALLPWITTLPVYWVLGAVAAMRAIFEMFINPFYWAKTTHMIEKHAIHGEAAFQKP